MLLIKYKLAVTVLRLHLMPCNYCSDLKSLVQHKSMHLKLAFTKLDKCGMTA